MALDGVQVDAYRQDAKGMEEALRLAVRGAGVRRSFGATSGRIFAAVMLESVCATALAGLLPAVIAFRAKVIETIRF